MYSGPKPYYPPPPPKPYYNSRPPPRPNNPPPPKPPPFPPPPKQDTSKPPNASAIIEEPDGEEQTPLVTLEDLARVQAALERAGCSPQKLRDDLVVDPELLQATIQEVAELVAEDDGLMAAEEYINVFMEEAVRVAPSLEVSGNIETDDYMVTQKVLKGGNVSEVRKRVRGDNVKELLRRIKYSVPITKFLSMDSNVREYLLYCALHVQAALGKPLMIPEYLVRKELGATEWEGYGKDLAARKPYRYTLAPSDKATGGTMVVPH